MVLLLGSCRLDDLMARHGTLGEKGLFPSQPLFRGGWLNNMLPKSRE